MGGSVDGEESFSWSSEDESEIPNSSVTSCPSGAIPTREGGSGFRVPSGPSLVIPAQGGGSSQMEDAGPSCSKSKLISHFVGMGFSEEIVAKAIKENGEEDTEAVLETLLTYSALEKSLPQCEGFPSDLLSFESKESILDDELSDMDSFLGDEENTKTSSEEDNLLLLVEMGFPTEEAASAVDRCGAGASLVELTDSIYAAQMAKTCDAHLGELPHSSSDDNEDGGSCSDGDEFPGHMKRSRGKIPAVTKRTKWSEGGSWGQRSFHCRQKGYQNVVEEDRLPSSLYIPKDMIGFGVPGVSSPSEICRRKLPEAAIGPPYFYYENVALTPKGVWETISRFLYDIEPEFVDSKHLCAAARKRGYIHNLPIHNRFPVKPLPPMTIQEALPMTRKWWPSWDKRTKLNCLQTCTASSRLTERIRYALVHSSDPPPLKVQQYVLNECRKWNLVWVGLHKVAPLEPDEIEMLLGFPRDHTRGGGISRTERYRSLGNSFQVDTVAYHLSVLKDIFPNGITLLSLFSGIGGAEVALHRLGIPLKAVVSVEISEINRNIVRSWWEQTNQQGTLIDIDDVQQLHGDRLEEFISMFGGFDLVIGGSPCNNLTGSNRLTRDGLEGKHSALFYDYFRILDLVKCIMEKQ